MTPAGPSPTPRPPQCPPGHGKYRMAGTAAFLQGGWPTWAGEPGRSGRVQPRFLPEAPPGPPTYRLPFLEMGAQGLLGVCCSWGCVSRCCPGPQRRGHGVPAQTDTSYREGVQSLQGQVDHSSGWKPWQFSGPAPPWLPHTLFLFIHCRSRSTLLLSQEHSSAPHCQPDFDFSDCHFLCFPIPPHSGFPATPPSTQSHRTPRLACLLPSPR